MKWTVGIEGPGLRRKHVTVTADDAVAARQTALEENPGYNVTIDVTTAAPGIGSGK